MSLDLAGVFAAGVLTFLSPCVLPLVPLYLVLLLGEAGQGGRRLSLFISTLFFALGMGVVFVLLGLGATWAGAALAAHRAQLTLIGGLVVLLFGLKMMGVLRVSWLDGEKRLDGARLTTRFHRLNAFVMGVVFSLGWTPCVGPMLGSVLTYTASKGTSPATGGLYLAAYAAGLVLPFVLLSLSADGARRLLDRLGPWLPRIEKAGGAILIVVGLFLMLGTTAAVGPSPSGTRAALAANRPATSSTESIARIGKPSLRPRLVEFSRPDCPICQQMIPTVGTIEKECGGKKVDVVKVSVAEPEGRRLAEAYGVRGVPTFVFLDRSGETVARLVGYQTLASLRQSLATLVGDQCEGVGAFHPDPPRPAPPRAPACSVRNSAQAPSPTVNGASQR